jgi:hypothetical protein
LGASVMAVGRAVGAKDWWWERGVRMPMVYDRP